MTIQNFGNPDLPPQGAVNARRVTDPGPHDAVLGKEFPIPQSPPATDVGDMPLFWSSFNIAHKRIQDGGWARQVTKADFGLSDAVSSVNMRLEAGGIRELHWHLAAEWAYMSYGKCRITILDQDGHMYVQDTSAGDLWYFPAGMPHSIQGLEPDGGEFVLVFDSGEQSEYNTLLLSEWLAHTPPEILALNFGVPPSALGAMPLNGQWIFQGTVPGSLAADQAEVQATGQPPEPFSFRLLDSVPYRLSASGSIHMADSTNFKASRTIAAALETVKPGAMRELHWHPNADEWQYYLQGEGRMTVFEAGPRAQTMDFRPGDVAIVKRAAGHYVLNTGTTDLVFLAVFRTDRYEEITLNDWLSHLPRDLAAQHLKVAPKVIAQFPADDPALVPG